MNLDSQTLDALWHKIRRGKAEEQEKVDAAAVSGTRRDIRYVPDLLRLLEDEAGQVRYYALQSLVLDLKQESKFFAERCWSFLWEDPDEDVRAMAAACLGSMYFGSRSARIFGRLLEALKNPEQPWRAKAPVYRALFEVAGRPPREWPGVLPPWKVFEESDIDWEKIAWLEAQMENP